MSAVMWDGFVPSRLSKSVMPGLVPGIHVLLAVEIKDVDGRDKPGHDVGEGLTLG
jgi:hypothetical protein